MRMSVVSAFGKRNGVVQFRDGTVVRIVKSVEGLGLSKDPFGTRARERSNKYRVDQKQ